MKTYAERKQRTPHTLVGHVGNSKQASLCEILQSSHDKLLERKAIQCQINNNSPGTKIKDELKILGYDDLALSVRQCLDV